MTVEESLSFSEPVSSTVNGVMLRTPLGVATVKPLSLVVTHTECSQVFAAVIITFIIIITFVIIIVVALVVKNLPASAGD